MQEVNTAKMHPLAKYGPTLVTGLIRGGEP